MEAFEGGRERGTLAAFIQLFRPTLGQDEGKVGSGQRERQGGCAS